MLFTSDEDLRDLQRASMRLPKGMTLSAEEARREAIEADRELREHRRWREFAFLLFIAPAIAGLVAALAQFIVVKLMTPPTPPSFP